MTAFADIIDAAEEANFSGVVTIDRAGARLFEHCRGFAHRAHRIPITPATRFGIASGSKGFTALAVMRLVEDGALALDEPVRPVLGGSVPRIDDAITLHHLLTHSSGIEDYLDESEDWDPSDYVMTVPVHTLTTAEAFLPMLEGIGQATAPGERFEYSNAGFILLALILERTVGKPFHAIIDRLVLRPAGMTDTGYLRLDDLPADAALGYLGEEGNRVNTLHLPVLGNGDGGAFTTAADLHAFWRALVDGRIVSRETVDRMTEPSWDVPEEGKSYGMGFWLEADGPGRILEGLDAGASFRSTHDPDSQTTVSVLGNTAEGAWPVIAAAGRVPLS
ncbi:class A beta-lactamase-related serine hydrolase [Flaviflexus salsibiostraticola]|uniref:Class A beta-lactamase-related serine hydrolase n=1 Tax=Flaviflexus salsibiostraticola TaxID=1282737 RepID=A0A3Q8WWG9_9ACTO|nr:serine hydrolase domain-containing protein [Flaviflexus salsibiostraticola]AZN30770.1 class A beta-lactamase-related serine hydrolase [Flaviflexus salsibiostraticola]